MGSANSGRYDAPLAVTDSITVMDMARKAWEMFLTVGMNTEADFAEGIYKDMRATVRRELVDLGTMTVSGRCQTSQSAALYYGVFEKCEEKAAFDRLIEIIEEKNGRMACGLLGLHTIFIVLSRFGRSDLAYDMIMADGYPSYAHLIDTNETSLIEKFMPDPYDRLSHNHHFLGDIVRWFTQYIAGLEVVDHKTVRVNKLSISSISSASAWYDLPSGRVTVSQVRGIDGDVKIEVSAPADVRILQ